MNLEALFALTLVGSPTRRSEKPEVLMAEYVTGNLASFEALYGQLSPRLFGYLLRLTQDRARAEDLVQITFTKVHRARSSYLLGSPVLPWLIAIARRSFLDERRHAKSRKEDLSRDGVLPEPGAPLDESELVETLERAMRKIPESYAEAIQLTKLTGLSVREAAQVLGATEAAVKLRVHRGYGLLREVLSEGGAR